MGTVFISCSHDSQEHSGRVLALAHALIARGIQVELDQFVESPEHGWAHWCAGRLQPENADCVLIVCTPTYRDRVLKKTAFDERGAARIGKAPSFTNPFSTDIFLHRARRSRRGANAHRCVRLRPPPRGRRGRRGRLAAHVRGG